VRLVGVSAIPTRVRVVVRQRDEGHCMRCGVMVGANGELHHRRRRGTGEDPHSLANVITLCGGPAHAGCHQWVHAHPNEAREGGFIVSTYPEIPVDRVVVSSFMGRIALLEDGSLAWL
jgi:hypothetical protein